MAKSLSGIEYLLALNEKHSKEYTSAAWARTLYRAQHPTEIMATKCMDGRLHLPVITETALGVIQPYRDLGGAFDLGWIGFQQAVAGWVNYALTHGRNCLMIVTYHYARGNPERGCRGFGYDVKKAQGATRHLKEQFDFAFGRSATYAIQVGIETDLDALVLHGDTGEVVDIATMSDQDKQDVSAMIKRLYPEMPHQIQIDLQPLIEGNIRRVDKVKRAKRPVKEVEHNEWMLGVGRGFDWLHEVNMAFLVGPFNPNLEQPIKTAAALLMANVKAGRAKLKHTVLLTSAPYRDHAKEKTLAELKARFLSGFAYDVIKRHEPELAKSMSRLTGTIDMHTRALKLID